MLKLLSFFTERKNFVLFVLLELISILLIIRTHEYHRVKEHDIQTEISGFFNSRLNVINNHLNLLAENDNLRRQNANLLKQLLEKNSNKTKILPNQFEVIEGYAIQNQYTFRNNTIIVNKGEIDGVKPDMGVIGTNGIVGIVIKTSKHYANVISILNKSSKISVDLKGSNYSGFLQWNGKNPNIFSVIDMPINAKLSIGDTIVTSGNSNIFPKNILIGKIMSIEKASGRKNYIISLQPFLDMTNLGSIYILKNNFKKEFDSIQTN